MLKLRLKPCGNKKKKSFQFLVMINKSKRNGRALFKIGYYNQFTQSFKIDFKTFSSLIKNGLQLSSPIRSFFYGLNILN
jgi:ribosomal protein S16